MSTFDKVGLYHSDIVKAGDVVVTITSEGPQKSKFAGKPNFIGFKCEGKDHTLNIENDAIGELLTGWKGQTVTLRASGRGDDATIEVLAADEPPPAARKPAPARPAPAANKPAPAQHKPAADPARAFQSAKIYMAQVSVLMEMALKASAAVCKKALPNATTEDVRAIAATIFIESKGLTQITNLPTKYPDASAPPKPEPPPPPPPPPPEHEPEPEPAADPDLAPDDIPF